MIELYVDRSPRIAHLRIALVLALASSVAAVMLVPYALALTNLRAKIAVPLPIFAALQAVQTGLVTLLLAWVGLRLGYDLGLDAPLLRRWLYADPAPGPRARWHLAVGLGATAGALCVALLATSTPIKPLDSATSANWWQGLLASFYGGIVEETLSRLFLVSVFVWAASKLTRAIQVSATWYWIAIGIAALLFGAAHLPALAVTGAFDAPNIARVVGLNALCGLVFGWLFWRYGLEHAMAGHFSADIVLHVVTPLLT